MILHRVYGSIFITGHAYDEGTVTKVDTKIGLWKPLITDIIKETDNI